MPLTSSFIQCGLIFLIDSLIFHFGTHSLRQGSKTSINIGIKHVFSCINIRQVPREVLKTEAGGRGFQHLPRDQANVNALKKHVRSLLLHKN